MRFLALGDSYTIGEGVAADARWPMQLARRLCTPDGVVETPAIVAVTGWTTDELAAGMDAAGLTPPYDLVSLLIGVNNQYRDRPLGQFANQFAELLARAVALAGDAAGRVFVVSIPDWGVTRFAAEKHVDQAAVAASIDAFNDAARTIAGHAGVAFVDVTGVSRQCGAMPEQLAADGLHPSALQYAAWTDRIAPIAQGILDTP
ncbi:MAG TPA: SGNH/GDSL hydrolase family protein [Rhodanobacteraceae bacterium]